MIESSDILTQPFIVSLEDYSLFRVRNTERTMLFKRSQEELIKHNMGQDSQEGSATAIAETITYDLKSMIATINRNLIFQEIPVRDLQSIDNQ